MTNLSKSHLAVIAEKLLASSEITANMQRSYTPYLFLGSNLIADICITNKKSKKHGTKKAEKGVVKGEK